MKYTQTSVKTRRVLEKTEEDRHSLIVLYIRLGNIAKNKMGKCLIGVYIQ